MWEELCRSNDLVEISWAQATLKAEGIATDVIDTHASAIEGSIGALPRRVVVAEDDAPRARWTLARAREALARDADNSDDDGS